MGIRLHAKFLFKSSNKVSNFSGLYLNLGKIWTLVPVRRFKLFYILLV